MMERFAATTKMNKLVRGEWHRTKSGKRAMDIIGTCMEDGGTVSARTWNDGTGAEWMKFECVWPKGEVA